MRIFVRVISRVTLFSPFRIIHGDVGPLYQDIHIVAVCRRLGHTDTDTDIQVVPLRYEGDLKYFRDIAGN